MKKLLLLVALLAAVVAWRDWGQREVLHPPGVLVSQAPVQSAPQGGAAPFELNGFRITPRADFRIRARVLSREDYFWGNEAALSPMDLALGWGVMSDQSVLDRIDISQGGRWYYTRYDLPAPLPDQDIIRNSGNMHLVPASDLVRRQIDDIRKGDVILATGRLVDVDHETGFYWRTSLTRNDTGGGSCEIFYVERIFIEPRG